MTAFLAWFAGRTTSTVRAYHVRVRAELAKWGEDLTVALLSLNALAFDTKDTPVSPAGTRAVGDLPVRFCTSPAGTN